MVLNTQAQRNTTAWALTEAGIYYFNTDAEANLSLNLYSFATNKSAQVTILKKGIQLGNPYITVSPDGRWLLYAQMDQQGSNIMLMENSR